MDISAGRFTAVLVASVFLVPAGLSAQGHQAHHPQADEVRAPSGMMGGGMTGQQSGMMSGQMMSSMMEPGPRMLLHQQDVLDLSQEQIQELEQLQARAEELHSTHRSEMTSVRDQLLELRGSEASDLDSYESLLREQADLRVDMHVRAARIHREALEVLTDEQRSNVRYGMRMMRSEGGMSGGMPGGGSGMMGMQQDMDQPQMTGMMMRMHRQMHARDCPMASNDESGS